MYNRIEHYISDHHLLEPDETVLVCVSGGCDSVVLLDALVKIGYHCTVAHCNFHLRDAESDRDEAFVRELAAQYDVDLHVAQFDTRQYAKSNKLSYEMAARELRYSYFERLRQNLNISKIAVAHHQNDQAETLLLNTIRGTGIRGLCGMRPQNGYIIRPLLCHTRLEITELAKINHLNYVFDSSNNDLSFKRNAIRKQLNNLNPSQIRHFAHLADRCQDYTQMVDDYVNRVKQEIVQDEGNRVLIDIDKLIALPTARTVLYEILYEYGFNKTRHIYKSLFRTSHPIYCSPQFRLYKHRHYLIISALDRGEYPTPLITTSIRSIDDHIYYPRADEKRAFFDSAILDKNLTIRHWEHGDYFCPLGMKGRRKLLSDFFTDLHLTPDQKESVWLLLADNDIAWVVGYRIDERYKLTPASQSIAEIKLK